MTKIYPSLCSSSVASISARASGWSVSPHLIQLSEIYHTPTLTLRLSPTLPLIWQWYTLMALFVFVCVCVAPLPTGFHFEAITRVSKRETKQHLSNCVPVFVLSRSMTTGWRTCTWTTGWLCQSTPVPSWCFPSRRSEIIRTPSGMCCTSDNLIFACSELVNLIHLPSAVMQQRHWGRYLRFRLCRSMKESIKKGITVRQHVPASFIIEFDSRKYPSHGNWTLHSITNYIENIHVVQTRSCWHGLCSSQTQTRIKIWITDMERITGIISLPVIKWVVNQTLHQSVPAYNSTLAFVSSGRTNWIFPEPPERLVIYRHGHLLDWEWQGQALRRDRQSGLVLGCGALRPPLLYRSSFERNNNKTNDIQHRIRQGSVFPYLPAPPTPTERLPLLHQHRKTHTHTHTARSLSPSNLPQCDYCSDESVSVFNHQPVLCMFSVTANSAFFEIPPFHPFKIRGSNHQRRVGLQRTHWRVSTFRVRSVIRTWYINWRLIMMSHDPQR